AVLIVSVKASNWSSLSFARPSTLAAALRVSTGFEGSTFAQIKLNSLGSTARKPFGNAANASRRKSAGWASFRAIRIRASEKFGALVLTCDNTRAAATAERRSPLSFSARHVLTASDQLAGGSFRDDSARACNSNSRVAAAVLSPVSTDAIVA